MQVELKRIQRSVGITTIFVTHDQSEALSLSDRIAVMAQGAVQQLSAPADLYRKPANSFVASFVGEVNRLPCALREEGDAVVLSSGDVELRLPRARAAGTPAGEAMLYVRPEALSVEEAGTARANLGRATVDAHIYQGTHVDLIVRAENGWLLRVRHRGYEALERWPVGCGIGVGVDLAEAYLFSA